MNRGLELHQEAVAAAAVQGGVVSHDQLTRFLGWSSDNIRVQLAAQRWQRVHTGVYAVTTGDLTIESRWWAAHLRCGDFSALTGESALQAWRIRQPTDVIELMLPYTKSTRASGLVIHRARDLPETRCPRGLPPTVLPQIAVLMVSNRLQPEGVMDLISSACQKRRVSPSQIRQAMPGMRLKHRSLITELLDDVEGGATTPLEIPGVKRILGAHSLPTGQAQVRERIGGRVVVRDRVIGNLIIEFDGRLGHADPASRFRDLDRDNVAVLTGRPTLRFGWVDVHDEPCRAADQVAVALSNLGVGVRLTPCSRTCGSQLLTPTDPD